MNAGDLRERVSILTATVTRDEFFAALATNGFAEVEGTYDEGSNVVPNLESIKCESLAESIKSTNQSHD